MRFFLNACEIESYIPDTITDLIDSQATDDFNIVIYFMDDQNSPKLPIPKTPMQMPDRVCVTFSAKACFFGAIIFSISHTLQVR